MYNNFQDKSYFHAKKRKYYLFKITRSMTNKSYKRRQNRNPIKFLKIQEKIMYEKKTFQCMIGLKSGF